jgi:hypothetical protein
MRDVKCDGKKQLRLLFLYPRTHSCLIFLNESAKAWFNKLTVRRKRFTLGAQW